MNRIRSTRQLPALLAAVFSLSIISGTAVPAHAVPERVNEAAQKTNDEHRKKIRKANDLIQKARDPMFPAQAKSLAKGYREAAEIVARQGGNPQPMLDAAAYFESQSEPVSRVSLGNKLPVR